MYPSFPAPRSGVPRGRMILALLNSKRLRMTVVPLFAVYTCFRLCMHTSGCGSAALTLGTSGDVLRGLPCSIRPARSRTQSVVYYHYYIQYCARLRQISPKRAPSNTHLWRGMGKQTSSPRGVRKVCRISRRRVPQACAAEAR